MVSVVDVHVGKRTNGREGGDEAVKYRLLCTKKVLVEDFCGQGIYHNQMIVLFFSVNNTNLFGLFISHPKPTDPHNPLKPPS